MKAVMLVLAALPALLLGAPEEAPAEITPATQKAIKNGLGWLARNQSKDGGWGDAGNNDVAFTALAGMAFLASGSTPKRGPYADNVSRAISYILSKADPTTGLIAPTNGSLIHCHGYAMLFLGEVHGMEILPEQRERIHAVLKRAVRLTGESQSAKGGWFYSPGSSDDEGSTTVTQVEGLRACRNAGIAVPIQTINKALDYLRKSQNRDGSIRYNLTNPGGGSPALTAAGLVCFYSLGDYDSKNVKDGLKYLSAFQDSGNMGRPGNQMYTELYSAQAFYLAGEPYWSAYWKSASKRLLKLQASEGNWMGDVGAPFDTAVACIILQIPYRYLPILQK